MRRNKKLLLNKETVRCLNGERLQKVVGAGLPAPITIEESCFTCATVCLFQTCETCVSQCYSCDTC